MKLEQMRIKELSDVSHTVAEELFKGYEYPWEVPGDTNGFIESLGASPSENEYRRIGKNTWIHKTAQMIPTTAMGGSMIIEPKVQIRNGVFLRGDVTLGQHVVIGNSCEVENSIILNEAQAPYFNYVGDSIPDYKAHMGTGAVASNVKTDKSLVRVHVEDGDMGTGHRKFGAILGDHAKTDCSSVLSPGTVIERNSDIHPLSSVRGCVSSDSIYKGQSNIVVKEARETETEQEAPETPEKGKGGFKVVK